MHWVDEICRDYGWSINQLARKAGLSPGTLGSAKTRNTKLKNMSWKVIMRLAKATGIEPEALVFMYDR